jgi:hypothetical protein
MSNYITKTLQTLMEEGLIPHNHDFVITETLLLKYIDVYGKVSDRKEGRFDLAYARRLAGLNLLKYKNSFDVDDIKEGILYAIQNKAWPDHFKIGITSDLNKRLASYQTYDPFRAYKVSLYEFVCDKRKTEKIIFDKFALNVENGEWLKIESCKSVIDFVRDEIMGYSYFSNRHIIRKT